MTPSKLRMTLDEPAAAAIFFASVSSVLLVPSPLIERILPSGALSPTLGLFST